MANNNRFSDQNLRISDFYNEVIVACPACKEKAIATNNAEQGYTRLSCSACGYNKQQSTKFPMGKSEGQITIAAHAFFGVELWLKAPFKDDNFFAYNYEHLNYLESYISAGLREHKDRTHFTVLEKLPKFYHEAKNRAALIKIITRLKAK